MPESEIVPMEAIHQPIIPPGEPQIRDDASNSLKEIAKIVSLPQIESIWTDCKSAIQFYLSYGQHSKPGASSSSAITNIVIQSLQGKSQSQIMADLRVSRSTVRSAIPIAHRALTSSLSDEMKATIGFQSAALLPTDKYVVETYSAYRKLLSSLKNDKRIHYLAKSNRHFYSAVKFFARGLRPRDLVGRYGVKKYFTPDDDKVASRDFRRALLPQENVDKSPNVPMYHFLRRILFSQYIEQFDSGKSHSVDYINRAFIRSAKILSLQRGLKSDNVALYRVQNFINNLPYIERIVANSEPESIFPIQELTSDVSAMSMLDVYEKANIVPQTFYFILELAAYKTEPKYIAAQLQKMGVNFSAHTMEKWIYEFLHYAENVLLSPKQVLRTSPDRKRLIKYFERQRPQEIGKLVQYLREQINKP